jgi:dipeptidyl aminopeptidase/acylaminoacyl peptidase
LLPAAAEAVARSVLHADRIKTPMMFLGGARDSKAPMHGGQQTYQALRSLEIDTQSIVYPNRRAGFSGRITSATGGSATGAGV